MQVFKLSSVTDTPTDSASMKKENVYVKAYAKKVLSLGLLMEFLDGIGEADGEKKSGVMIPITSL